MTKKMFTYFGLAVVSLSLLASTAFAASNPGPGTTQVVVTNSPAQPVPIVGITKDSDAPARKSFQTKSISVTAPAGSATFQSVIQVPANQRLVIEHVSGGCGGILYTSGYVALATDAGNKGIQFLDRTFVATNQNDIAIINIGSESIRFYADPGDDFGIYVSNLGQQTGYCTIAMSGYYVNLP